MEKNPEGSLPTSWPFGWLVLPDHLTPPFFYASLPSPPLILGAMSSLTAAKKSKSGCSGAADSKNTMHIRKVHFVNTQDHVGLHPAVTAIICQLDHPQHHFSQKKEIRQQRLSGERKPPNINILVGDCPKTGRGGLKQLVYVFFRPVF